MDTAASTIVACQAPGAGCLPVRYSVPEAGVVCSWTVGRVANAGVSGPADPATPQPRILDMDDNAALYTMRKDWVPGEPQVKATNQVLPNYPMIAKAAHVQGNVVIVVTVNAAGEVARTFAKEGHPMLQAEALDAAAKWRFEPILVGSRPIAFRTRLIFDFTTSGPPNGVVRITPQPDAAPATKP